MFYGMRAFFYLYDVLTWYAMVLRYTSWHLQFFITRSSVSVRTITCTLRQLHGFPILESPNSPAHN